MAERRIACLTLLSTPGPCSQCVDLPEGLLIFDMIPVKPDLARIRVQIRELLNNYDAVALEGVTTTFRIGNRTYRHDYLWEYLGLDELGDRFSDGSGMRSTLERFLVRQAADQLRPEIEGKRILLLSGLNRYGSADVLSGFSRKLVFGDLLYGFRLGIPINSFKAFVNSAPRLVRLVAHTPMQWFWPAARTHPARMPRFQPFFRGADVIVGGFSYFERFMPRQLDGKIIFTSIYRDEDLEPFASRGAATVVSLTPVINGTYVPLAVLGAYLKLSAIGRVHVSIDDYYLDCLTQLSIRPAIFDLRGEPTELLAAGQIPRDPPAPMEPVSVAQLNLAEHDEVAKFCFVIHPLSFKYMQRLKMVRAASHFLPQGMIEHTASHIPHFPVGTIKNITSRTGAKAEGVIIAIPVTSKLMMRYPPEFLYRKLTQVAKDAEKLGCRILGLGAYTSVVGDAGVTVSRRSPIGVTSGNSYTVAATLKTLETAAARCGIDVAQSRALVVGATGSIGSICARLLAPKVDRLYLVSPRPEKLLELSRIIMEETPSIRGNVQISRNVEDFLPLAEIAISTTSAIDATIDVSRLRPGCVVCDVARPPDIKQEAAESRADVLVIESGEIRLPQGAQLNYDIGLPPGTIYACLAETMLLALDRRFGHFTLGREIDPGKVELISEIGEKHGFELAAIRSFGEVVPEERFERMRKVNLGRGRSATGQANSLRFADGT